MLAFLPPSLAPPHHRPSPSAPPRAAPPTCTAAPHPTRRAVLSLAAALLLSPLSPSRARAGIQTTMSDGGFAEPEDAAGLAAAAAGRTLDMAQFRSALQRGEVTRVWFFGTLNDRCFFERAGQIARIGDGYPVENPASNESPLWVMAQVRDQ